MGSAEALLNVKRAVTDAVAHDPVIVVVSAMSGVTNQLIDLAQAALNGDEIAPTIEQIKSRHHQVIDQVIDKNPEEVRNYITAMTDALKDLVMILAANPTLPDNEIQTMKNAVVSYGEAMSSIIASVLLRGTLHNAMKFIRTHAGGVDWITTKKLVGEEFPETLSGIHVTQGFIASDAADSAIVTNLGRGGSDFTAPLIAAATGAGRLEIWTDVDGFYDSDPRKNPDAKLIRDITYRETIEQGLKVMDTSAFQMCLDQHIPCIRIFNMDDLDNILRVARGEAIGTVVHE